MSIPRFVIKSIQFNIMSGPSEEQVSEAVRKFTKQPDHTVSFTLGTIREPFNMRIQSMGAEGGLDQWILKGHSVNHPQRNGSFECYYNSRKRSGKITFLE